jgi:glucoamylase
MMPEQVWDEPNLAGTQLRLGEPGGSAVPLVWAHAEYLKLLRSAADGRVFDRIQIVEDRYTAKERTFTNHMEIFEIGRPISTIFSGYTLRIVDREAFRVVYSFDNWATVQTMDSRSVGYPGSFVDISTAADQTGSILFTLLWPGEHQQDRWLGRNIDVAVIFPPA